MSEIIEFYLGLVEKKLNVLEKYKEQFDEIK
jgi:hypothetical protein